MRHKNDRRIIKLHFRRDFIIDDCAELIPEWCHGLEGSSVDNLSRDSEARKYPALDQEESCTDLPRHVWHVLVGRKDDYKQLYEQFGMCLKLGIHENSTNRTQIAELFRFNNSKLRDEPISLKVSWITWRKTKPEQHLPSIAVVSSSPFLQALRKKDPQVVCTVDLVDVFAVHLLREFGVQKLKSTTKVGLDVGDEDEKNKLGELKAEFEALAKFMKEVLGDTVGTVIVTD